MLSELGERLGEMDVCGWMQADHNALTQGVLGSNWLDRCQRQQCLFLAPGVCKTQFLQTSCYGAGHEQHRGTSSMTPNPAEDDAGLNLIGAF